MNTNPNYGDEREAGSASLVCECEDGCTECQGWYGPGYTCACGRETGRHTCSAIEAIWANRGGSISVKEVPRRATTPGAWRQTVWGSEAMPEITRSSSPCLARMSVRCWLWLSRWAERRLVAAYDRLVSVENE